MAIDAYVEHESFPEVNDDRYDMVVSNGHFCVSVYRVIKDDLILADLNEEQLVALREEIDNRLCPKPFTEETTAMNYQELVNKKIDRICQSLGIPKRVLKGEAAEPLTTE